MDCAVGPRSFATLEESVAWCRGVEGCTGFWRFDNGRTCPKQSWTAESDGEQLFGRKMGDPGGFYELITA